MIHTMKSLYKCITIGVALLAGTIAASSQTHSEGGVTTAKNVTGPDENGYYTIKLETFATGNSALTETGVPVDIVLVLDVSGSMNDNLSTTYTYTARNSQAYSYNDYGNNTYYYLHTDGNYYPVERERPREWVGLDYSRRYRLYYEVGNTTYYLSGTSVTTTAPTNVTGGGTTIWTGVLYTRSTETQTKMDALKTAVTAFVNEVNHNALYDTDGNLRGTPLQNQISIVKFANDKYYTSESSIAEGNHRNAGFDTPGYDQAQNYNYTEVLKGFKDVSTDAGVNSLIQQNQGGINAIDAGGATAAHYGLTKAKYLLRTVKNRESSKVVVFFTDGIPGISGWDNSFANGAIAVADSLKMSTDQGGYGATVYAIGVFNDLGNDAANANTYMNYVSSNYPNATSMTSGGTGSDQGYYQNASNADLTAIFKDIASSASQSDATIGASTQVRDVVSNSFILPEDTEPTDITVYSMTVTEDGEGWADRQNLSSTGNNPDVTIEIKNNTCSDGIVRRMLSVEGFDFSKDDIKDELGYTTRANAGNWVGERYKSKTETFWAGKKLVIEFKVLANGEATGGEGTNTNHPDSGVYIYNADTGQYSNVNHYPVPHTTLPLILRITKTGLRHGESATFEIHMCDPLMEVAKDDEGHVLKSKVDPTKDSLTVAYNAIGKPLPDKTTERNWSKVVLTNKGNDGSPVTKVLMALDPHYVYSVVEDDWGWAYELTGSASTITTSDMEVNPFIFTNTEKSNVVKHAEAVSINHFATSGTANDAYTEDYKSSKVESFGGTTGGGSTGGSTGGGSK